LNFFRDLNGVLALKFTVVFTYETTAIQAYNELNTLQGASFTLTLTGITEGAVATINGGTISDMIYQIP